MVQLSAQPLRGAAIEAPFALLQLPVETFFANPVDSAPVPFGWVPNVFDAVAGGATCGDARLTVVHASVTELGDSQRVLRTEAGRIPDAIGPNPLTADGHQRLGCGIGEEGGNHIDRPG